MRTRPPTRPLQPTVSRPCCTCACPSPSSGCSGGLNAARWPTWALTANAMSTLDVQNIHKRYGDNEVLKGVSLSANSGDVICILGSSGSGKSTFLRCINFLEKPDQGSVSLNG